MPSPPDTDSKHVCQHPLPSAQPQANLHKSSNLRLHSFRSSEPWPWPALDALLAAYNRSVNLHGTVRWADVTPLFPARSKEACKAQVKTHKARLRARGTPAPGFAPPPPLPPALLDLDAPVGRRVVGRVVRQPPNQDGVHSAVGRMDRTVRSAEAIDVCEPAPMPKLAKARRKLSAREAEGARRALRGVANLLEEHAQWHA